jgi:hypothetical protein
MERNFRLFLNTALLSGILTSTYALSSPVQWRISDGGNGHWYEAFYTPEGISWNEAYTAAQLIGPDSHLVTINNAQENTFVFSLVTESQFWYQPLGWGNAQGPWLGGYQAEGSVEPNSGWRWVTDEPFTYANWGPGEPNNSGGSVLNEDSLHFWGIGEINSTWNDSPEIGTVFSDINGPFTGDRIGQLGYIVEMTTIPIPPSGWLIGTAVLGTFLFGYKKKQGLNHSI